MITSMLTGAEVRGWRYSGCSKWPECAVSMVRIFTGSLLACRRGSEGFREVNLMSEGELLIPEETFLKGK